MAQEMPKVQGKNLTKKFGDLLVLDNISFDVPKGEFLCIVGPTGCGKTTFLNSLTKLYKPTACPADAEKIERYIETKVDGNLKKLHDDRILRELMGYGTLRINGTTYRNLNQLGWMFDQERLRKLFDH